MSEKLLEATEQALPIVQALTADDATADLNQEAVEQLMAVFQDRVTNAMAQEERIHPAAALHEWLREAIVSVVEQSPASPSWGFVPTTMVARGRSPGRHKGKEKGKPKAKGKPQAPEPQPTTTAEPEFYRISDPFGADTFLGSRDPEMDADYREAILLESLRAEREFNDPFPGDSSDDGMTPSSGKTPRMKPSENLTKLLLELVNRSLVKRNPTQSRSSSLPLLKPISFRCVTWLLENSSAWIIKHEIQFTSRLCRTGTDRQTRTAMRKTVLKRTPGTAGVLLSSRKQKQG